MPPLFRKPVRSWLTAGEAAAKQPAAKPKKNRGPIKGTAPVPPPNLGALRPELNPRLTVKGGQVLVELGGNKITLDQLEAMVKQAGAPKDVMAEVARLKQVEAAIKQLPPTEGGKLASFEQARALASARQGGDPTSAHYDPNRKRRYIPKPDKTPEEPSASKRFEKDLGGTPAVPSKVEEILPPEASELITKGRSAIDAMGRNNPVVTARTMSKIFERAELLVRDGKVSKEVADSIRNRIVETLMKVPGGDETLRAMKMGDIRGVMTRAEQKTLERRPKGKKGKEILQTAESRLPPALVQDAEGNLTPRQESRNPLMQVGTGIMKELARLFKGKLDPEDIAAAREAKAIGKAGQPSKGPPTSDLDRLRQIIAARRPGAPTPGPDLPISRTRPGLDTADIRALKKLRGPEPEVRPEIQEVLAGTSDPDLLLQRLSKLLPSMPKPELAQHIDKFLDARAAKLRQIAEGVNRPSARRVGVVTSTRKGVSQVEQMQSEEAQDLVEALGRNMRIVPPTGRPPIDVPGTMRGARVIRGMERATTKPDDDPEYVIMLARIVNKITGGDRAAVQKVLERLPTSHQWHPSNR